MTDSEVPQETPEPPAEPRVLGDDCGPHCGVKDKIEGHCPTCHEYELSALVESRHVSDYSHYEHRERMLRD